MSMPVLVKHLRYLSASAAVAAFFALSGPSFAVTPADTLVEGFAIDDIITLDPGEAFEISTAEVTGNTYSLLVRLDLDDTTKVKGDLADSWTVSDDGLTYTFKLKPDLKFASGNPVTADDVVFSVERLIKMDKSPAFLFGQFGLTGDNVAEKVKAIDPLTVSLTVDKPYATSFVLNVLTSTAGAVLYGALASRAEGDAGAPAVRPRPLTAFLWGWATALVALVCLVVVVTCLGELFELRSGTVQTNLLMLTLLLMTPTVFFAMQRLFDWGEKIFRRVFRRETA